MRSADTHTVARTMQMRADHESRQAAVCRLSRQARTPHRDRLSLQARRLVCEAGCLLVALGARLEPEPSVRPQPPAIDPS